jgi:hypothetical protein
MLFWGAFKIEKKEGQIGDQGLEFTKEFWFGDKHSWITESIDISECKNEGRREGLGLSLV